MPKLILNWLGILAILLISLKLTSFITWHWFIVLSPIWCPISLVIVGIVIFYILARQFRKNIIVKERDDAQ